MSDRALGIYVHWPYCARLCPYCDFNIYKDKGGDADLLRAILADLRGQAQRIDKRAATSVHFGGGTPSLLTPRDISAIVETIADCFGLMPDAEIGLEANPDGFTLDVSRSFAAAGINRMSLGVQALDFSSLKALGRTHDPAQAFAAIEAAQSAFERVSLDLIYARANQTIADWRLELMQAAATGVGHISPYQLTIEEGTAFAKSFARGRLPLPGADLAADFYEATQEVLEAAGLPGYEISNHARSAADQSRHNLLYWRSHDWVGVGPGAHGRVAVDGVRTETEAHALPKNYVAAVNAAGVGWDAHNALCAGDVRIETILMGVRIVEGLPVDGLDLDARTLASLSTEGLAGLQDGRLRLSPKGRLLADRIGEMLVS
jgi:putative oxygen-independent coproporphyrinogen III oxidase